MTTRPASEPEKFLVEAQEPCGARLWVQLRPPAYYEAEAWANGGEHDGYFEAESAEEAIQQWLDAYPAYPHRLTPGAKAYLSFRAVPVLSLQAQEYVLVKREEVAP